jgi:hypothetical protein
MTGMLADYRVHREVVSRNRDIEKRGQVWKERKLS